MEEEVPGERDIWPTVEGLARLMLQRLWWWLRQVSGDAAYENYLDHASRLPGGLDPPLTRQEFYLEVLRRRYAQVSRCC